MDRIAEVVDQLIAYWGGDPALGEDSRLHCRELTGRLARIMSPTRFATIRRDPSGHRETIERWVEELAFDAGPTRNLVPDVQTGGTDSPGTDPGFELDPDPDLDLDPVSTRFPQRSPPPAGIQNIESISGSGNIGFNLGTVAGPLSIQHMAQAPATQSTPGTSSSKTGAASASPAGESVGDGPIRILFLGANPTDGVRLRLDHEVREIDHALRLADLGSKFELCQKWAVRPSDLQAHLLRHRPHILHFSGHGGPGGAILFEGEDGATRPVEAVRLARLLAQFNRRLRCVFLNACYSKAQASAIAGEIDCVIGMSSEVIDQAAIRFAANFYQALAFGCSVKAAFDLCRADIEVGEMNQDTVLQLVAVRQNPAAVEFVRVP